MADKSLQAGPNALCRFLKGAYLQQAKEQPIVEIIEL